ncbi:MAG: hypothetical protein KDC80_03655 [Saprospiraceae bacterium]|nr:hypothetical protein [Saprospiraceae bacterium]
MGILPNTHIVSQITPPEKAGEIHGCATPAPSLQQIQNTLSVISQVQVNQLSGSNCIAIKAHIFRNDDGTGGISNASLSIALSYLNSFYSEAGLQFYYCGQPNYINNSDLYVFDATAPDNDTESALAAATTEANDAVNIFFVNSIKTASGSNACGYAYYPTNLPQFNRIVMRNSCTAAYPNGTFVHEFGHYFNLYHTHQGTENGPSHISAENVPRSGPQSNCSTDGDLLCDTDADPRYDSGNFNSGTCSYTGSETDQFGNLYTPPVNNIMSYYPDACGGIFTPDQITRIQQGYLTRDAHSSYSLHCTPPAVPVPTDLTATLDNNLVNLSWTDMASNEMGYLVERSSTSSSAGYEALAGGAVGPDGTDFTDFSITGNQTYWYRIKPANGDCETYSSVAMVEVGTIFCPANSNTCDEYISRVQCGDIDNSSACGTNGYTDYTHLSTSVTPGTGIAITVENGTSYSQDECGIWIDWNQDGDFDDAEEELVVTGNPGGGPYSATINTPPDALPGDHILRIRITYDKTPESCGTDPYGEVEDYTLNVESCSGSVNFWNGATSTDWTQSANWDCGIPISTTDVIIPAGLPEVLLGSGLTGYGKTLEVELGAQLSIAPGAGLNIGN